MTEQIAQAGPETNVAIVEKFLYALRDKDLDTAGSLLADNLVYQNVGLPTIHGRRRTVKLLSRVGFDVKIHHSAADGDVVLNQRTDAIILGQIRLNFWVCGVFEVHGGQITLWRDYFDAFDFTKAIVRGLAGAVVPSLQRKF